MCKSFAWSCVELDAYGLDAKRNSCNYPVAETMNYYFFYYCHYYIRAAVKKRNFRNFFLIEILKIFKQ